MNLVAVAEEIQHRIIHIFGRDVHGRRATNGGNAKLNFDPHFRDYVWFHEASLICLSLSSRTHELCFALQYFHADTGRGLGASHQTGWSALVAYHILQSGVSCRLPKTPRSNLFYEWKISLTDAFYSCLAPRSVSRHYFDVCIPIYLSSSC